MFSPVTWAASCIFEISLLTFNTLHRINTQNVFSIALLWHKNLDCSNFAELFRFVAVLPPRSLEFGVRKTVVIIIITFLFTAWAKNRLRRAQRSYPHFKNKLSVGSELSSPHCKTPKDWGTCRIRWLSLTSYLLSVFTGLCMCTKQSASKKWAADPADDI